MLDDGIYYKSPDEDLSSLVSELSRIWRYPYIYISEVTYGSYVKRDWEIYEGMTKIRQGTSVYDDQKREIADKTTDINTSLVKKLNKIHYLQNFANFIDTGDVLNFGSLNFDYTYSGLEPGEIRVEINLPGYDHKDYFIRSNQNILISDPYLAEVFDWASQSYYHRPTPFIPTS